MEGADAERKARKLSGKEKMDRAADGMTSPSLTDVMNTYQGLPLAQPDTGSRYC